MIEKERKGERDQKKERERKKEKERQRQTEGKDDRSKIEINDRCCKRD